MGFGRSGLSPCSNIKYSRDLESGLSQSTGSPVHQNGHTELYFSLILFRRAHIRSSGLGPIKEMHVEMPILRTSLPNPQDKLFSMS